jgi:excinuclease ABC subunit A
VITGVSGSGKSSLAFDTLYAEGQRRYVTSLSTYARQFLERLPRPDVDFISNLPPAIAIERRNRVTNARSTVGTATEILDHLRLLYAHAGEARCPDCARPVFSGSVESVTERILDRFSGVRIALCAPPPARPGERPKAMRERLLRQGYTRLLDDEDRVQDVSELSAAQLGRLRRSAVLLVDRVVPGSRREGRARVAEAVAAAFERGEGRCVVVPAEGERVVYRAGFACEDCGRELIAPVPALFSFNSSLGACQTCQGFGRVARLDRERVLPDASRSLVEGAIAPFATPSGRAALRKLLKACERREVAVDVPVCELSDAQRDWIFRGDGRVWRGVEGFFARLERKRYKVQTRVLIARYRRFETCEACGGGRLRPEALCVRVAGRDLAQLSALTLGELADWLASLPAATAGDVRVGRLLQALRARVRTVVEVGLDYVTLDRQTRTLSGGEAQRIQLATALGGALTASLYVLDEPSIGLHAHDVGRLLDVLRRIRDQGNTLVVVEHSPDVIASADHLIDLGPGAGRHGGRVVAEGSVAQVRDDPDSLTGQMLSGKFDPIPRKQRAARAHLRVVDASANNLRNVSVDIPLGQLVAFTGVSGAGKSTLVRSVLVGQLRREPERGPCRRIEGASGIVDVVVVEQAPPARSPRSNPATVTGAFEPIRRRFAATREARARGLTPGWFSFNVAGGRCDVCEGAGEVVVDMQFLDDVRMACEQCDGSRYRHEAREIRCEGLSIVDVLGMSVDEICAHFASDAKILERLAPLQQVGLGYLTLGQPLSTLSGGEAQRLRIARALTEDAQGVLFVLDEPTTGLHAVDIRVLLACFDALLEAGASLLVVEHNLDVIRRADHVIDLGPGGGPEGGRVLAAGTPEEIARCAQSLTGAALRAGH